MTILAIETSCDETAAAVVADGERVLSSVVASQTDLHEEFQGVVPEIASRAHAERILPVVRAALEDAGVGLGMVDAVAVGHRPGLIGSLLVGVSSAKALAWSLGLPLVGVDHVHAHLYAGTLRAGDEPRFEARFPALGLVVSGGHTTLFALRSWTDITRLGATIDDALGEAYDKAATILALPFPGGPSLDALARDGGGDEHAFDLPISRLAPGSLDFSFSGLKTALLYKVRGVPGEGRDPQAGARAPRTIEQVTPCERADLAASFQRAAVSAVTLKLDRALDRAPELVASPFRSVLTGGGVTANSRLRSELQALADRRAVPLALPRLEWCVDNAAMIAGLAHHALRAGMAADLTLQADPASA